MNKESFFFAFFILIATSCGNNEVKSSDNADSIDVAKINDIEVKMTTQEDYKFGFYLINVSASADKNEAIEGVRKLNSEGYPSGYLWIKNFESLSGKELYSIFIGPFKDIDLCLYQLEKYKKIDPKAYAVKAEQSNNRIVIYGRSDFRVNNRAVGQIYAYLNDGYREEFYNRIVDWGYIFNGMSEFYEIDKDKWVYIGRYFKFDDYTPRELRRLGLDDLKSEKYGCILIKGDSAEYFDISTNTIPIFEEAEKYFWK